MVIVVGFSIYELDTFPGAHDVSRVHHRRGDEGLDVHQHRQHQPMDQGWGRDEAPGPLAAAKTFVFVDLGQILDTLIATKTSGEGLLNVASGVSATFNQLAKNKIVNWTSSSSFDFTSAMMKLSGLLGEVGLEVRITLMAGLGRTRRQWATSCRTPHCTILLGLVFFIQCYATKSRSF